MPEAMASTDYKSSREILGKKKVMDKMASQAPMPEPAAPAAAADSAPQMTKSESGMMAAGQAVDMGDPVSSTASGALQGAAVGGPMGAVVGGAIGLAKGLFTQKAQSEARKRKAVIDSMKAQMEGEQKAAGQMVSGYGTGLGAMQAGYGRALG